MNKNFTKSEIFYINNLYLKAQAKKLLKQKSETRSEIDRADFWYVFHKLNPGYEGKKLQLRSSVQSFVLFYDIRVVVLED